MAIFYRKSSIAVFTAGLLLCSALIGGHRLFGISGSNAIWYFFGLAIPYLLLHLLLAIRLNITAHNQRPTTRSVWVLAACSWVTMFGFVLTVPDVQADGTLASIVAMPGADPVALEMSVALCNPFIILAFLCVSLACAVSWHNSRPPYVDED